MADAITNNYSITLPLVGGDSGTWGTVLNNSTFTPIDAILGANFSTTITSADVTLTTTQFQNSIFLVNGTLTGNRNLIVPISTNLAGTACGGRFVVVNNGAGAFNLSVKTAATGSLGVSVPQGFAAFLYSDTVNVGYASNGLPGFATSVNGNPNGQLAGTAGSVNTNAQTAFDYTNGVFYLCTTSGTSGSAIWSQPTFTIPRGFDTPVNLSFTTSIAANSLTITAVAASTGTTPTITNPIIFPFRDSTLTKGDPVTVNATAALSIQIFSAATLGASNGVPFRGWIVAFNKTGTVQLGVINCSNSNGVFGLNETNTANSQAMTTGAISTGVFYTPANSTATSSAFRIVGFFSYETPLTTAGTYNNPPDVVQLFGPGVKKPGDIANSVFAIATASTSLNTTSKLQTNTQVTISPTSNVNLIQVQAEGNMQQNSTGSNTAGLAQLGRSSAAVFGNISAITQGGNGVGSQVSLLGMDLPATTSPVTYSVFGWATGATFQWIGVESLGGGQFATTQSFIKAMEIIG